MILLQLSTWPRAQLRYRVLLTLYIPRKNKNLLNSVPEKGDPLSVMTYLVAQPVNIRKSCTLSKTGAAAVVFIRKVKIALEKWSVMTRIALTPIVFLLTSRKSIEFVSQLELGTGTERDWVQ